MDVSSALSAPWDGEWWQAAAGDERIVRLCRRVRGKLTKHLFSTSSCYIHCYLAACECLLFAWTSLAASTRGFSRLSHPPVTQLIIFQLMPPPRAADLRKHNSDSCRYEPPMGTCTPSQPPSLSSGIAYHYSTTGPLAACHLVSPRLAKAHPNSDHPARLRGFMLQGTGQGGVGGGVE